MLTTGDALKRLAARGIPATYSSLARWLADGLLPGAARDDSHPRGVVWRIPADAVEKFTPPKKGRPPKPKAAESRRSPRKGRG